MRPTTGKRLAAAVAGITSIVCCQQDSCALSLSATFCAFLPSTNRGRRSRSRPTFFAQKQSPRSSFSIIEEVQPMTSASNEKRISAIEALRKQTINSGSEQQRTNNNSSTESPLFDEMNAAAMLLETLTQATAKISTTSSLAEGSPTSPSALPVESPLDDRKQIIGVAQKRMGSVAGATSMGMLRLQAAREGGYSIRPRDSKHLYRDDGSNEARWAVGSLIEKLDEKIKERSNDYGEWMDAENENNGESITMGYASVSEKRKRGRPRKNSISDEGELPSTPSSSMEDTVTPHIAENADKSAAKVTGGSLMKKGSSGEANMPSTTQSVKLKSISKVTVKGTSAKKDVVQPSSLYGANAIVNKQRNGRQCVAKSLPVSRLNKNSKITPQVKQRTQQMQEDTRNYDVTGKVSNDSLNLNRYYKTELLKANEEYSLGMKVKFMVKCQAVHEGLTLQLDRMPTIAEWAAACGFDSYDTELCSEKYVDDDLDWQIRPSGCESDQLDPNMFIGNGLVTDTGVGRGKGRAKKPPPTQLKNFYDDSYEKFKRKKSDNTSKSGDNGGANLEDESDIFLHRQKTAPGEPINRGSPRVFREMMLTSKEAKQRMVQCNMRLVVSIARRYHGVGVNVQDLVQEGSLGLARAAEKFDPKKGFKFSTYASWWIQQAVFRSIAYHSRTIRLPVHVHNLLNKVRRARQILQQELGRVPTNEEMAGEMDMPLDKYNKMIRNTRNAISLERPKYMNNPKDLGHESEAVVGDMVDSSAVIFDEKTPEQNVDHGLLHSDIQYMLGKLGEDERNVLCLRYGINDGITRTVTLVASELRQTKSWVRSQECRALRKLRRPWYERRLKEHRESLQASHSLPL